MTAGPEAFTAPEALRSIAEVSRRDGSLKARTEGLTWIVWGLTSAGGGLTYAATLTPAGTIPPWAPLFAGLWFVAALLVTVGVWRSAALTFPTGMTARRTTAFFLGWIVLTALLASAIMAPAGIERAPVAKVVAMGVLLVGFAATNPLGFTERGRATAVGIGLATLAAGALGFVVGLDGGGSIRYASAVFGLVWTAGGLLALFRG